MANYTIFTNNVIVADFFGQKDLPIDLKWVAAPAIEVLTAAKLAAKQGAVVLSNPLSGIRTNQPLFGDSPVPPASGRTTANISSINPYLTVLTSPPGESVDFGSVKRLNEALDIYKKNARLRFIAHNDDTVKVFQAADLEMTLAVLAHIAGRGE